MNGSLELAHSTLGEGRITAQIMPVENGAHVGKRQSTVDGDLGLTGFAEGKPRHRRPPQIMKREALNAGLREALRQDDRKPSLVHGWLSLLTRMSGLFFTLAAASKAIFSGLPTGTATCVPSLTGAA